MDTPQNNHELPRIGESAEHRALGEVDALLDQLENTARTLLLGIAAAQAEVREALAVDGKEA